MLQVFDNYLKRQQHVTKLPLLPYAPISVIIPCYNETNILETLDSLWKCISYEHRLLIIVIVNHSSNSSVEIINQNKKTIQELTDYKKKYETNLRRLEFLDVTFAENESGVGTARKIGMDEAIHQYAQHQKEGILVSLDADTLCAINYLSEIYRQFNKNPNTNALIINYQHQLNNLSEKHRLASIQYELYLRYMTLAYRYIGHPNAFHTIGSTFAVSASAYCKQNGMNRRQAGEDFYFLQKIFQLGNCYELNTTCVYPSSRTSDRVPFGTGKAVAELIAKGVELETYSFKAFEELRDFFAKHKKLYKIEKIDYEYIVYNEVGGLIKSWLIENDFFTELEQINNNCASEAMFSKKFFESFSIFQIIKYLNFSHTHFLQKVGIFHAIQCLPNIDITDYNSPEELLNELRILMSSNQFIKK